MVGLYASLVPSMADIPFENIYVLFDALSGAIISGVVNNSLLTLQELDMIMLEITGHIVPSLPELRETKV